MMKIKLSGGKLRFFVVNWLGNGNPSKSKQISIAKFVLAVALNSMEVKEFYKVLNSDGI